MIYPESFEQKIRFTRIRELVKEHCLSSLGKERVDAMRYLVVFDKVETLVKQTEEFRQICLEETNFPASYFIDVRPALQKLRVEGLFLEEKELFDLRRSLLAVKDIVRFFKNKEEEEVYPYLKKICANVVVYPYVFERIEGVLNKFGKIKDNASPELARIRNDIFKKQSGVSKRLAAILSQAKKAGLVEGDVSVAIRDGRAVIPVPAANKRKLSGIVHDESATGKTSFIEPTEIVEVNNEIRELAYAEKREVIKILTQVSNDIKPYLDDLLYCYEFLGIIDFIRAKAKFAIQINAILPAFSNQTKSRWDSAVHPLLYLQHAPLGKEVVPLDIEFNDQQRIILISGPNAGGKSVCLQTVGLLQFMFQCGMLVPMAESSYLGFFKDILMDMGDEQSIENDLSTYSSHLTNMKHFLRHSSEQSLLLIDEFGTGTEPMLGGAIAESVLNQLNKNKVFGVITTHYTNLKHFASGVEGIENGAMLFDTGRIRPMYKLQIGQPGSSFAFEIARKIGVPEAILEEAQQKVGEDHINFDKHLREITRDKRYWQEKRENVRKQDKQLQSLVERYGKDLEGIKRERKEIIEQAKRDAEALLSNANKQIENTIRTIRESQAEKEKTKDARKQLNQFKEGVAKQEKEEKDRIDRKIEKLKEREKRGRKKKAPVQEKEPEKPLKALPIEKGDRVKLEGQSLPGEVMEVNGKEAVVAFGNMITTVKLLRLEKLSNKEFKREIRSSQASPTESLVDRIRDKKINFKPDIDVRGMRAEEALQKVMNHIDDAIMCSSSKLKILHGKGNGILRHMIREYLGSVDLVSDYRDEALQFGGSGITVVELDV